MRGVDQRPAQYGYQPDGRNDGGYRLKDRAASEVLKTRVLKPLSLLVPGATVIDLGSGDGNFVQKAGSSRPYDIVAVDLEASAVRSVNKIFTSQRRRGQDHNDVAVVGDISRLSDIPELSGQADAAVSWRVLHGIPADVHQPTFGQVYDKLRPGASFYIAVASDQDWKVDALGDQYRPGQTNDCAAVMFRDHGVDRDHAFPILFFSEDRMRLLAEQTGFTVGSVALFEEPSGYPHLKDGKPNTYLFAELVKPLDRQGIAVPEAVAADSTTIVNFATGRS